MMRNADLNGPRSATIGRDGCMRVNSSMFSRGRVNTAKSMRSASTILIESKTDVSVSFAYSKKFFHVQPSLPSLAKASTSSAGGLIQPRKLLFDDPPVMHEIVRSIPGNRNEKRYTYLDLFHGATGPICCWLSSGGSF